MEKFIVREKVQLNGSVRVGGAKNAALPIMAAAVMTSGICRLNDVPDLTDICFMQEILTSLGARVRRIGSCVEIDASGIQQTCIPELLMQKMRASLCLMGALLGRFHTAQVSFPGGCDIGERPIDLHIKALERLGAEIEIAKEQIRISALHLEGGKILLDFPSVGATENALLAAVLAKGETLIDGAACEPEIVDLAQFLSKMGAKIYGAGTNRIRVEGVDCLYPVEYTIMPDRIQAGTFLLAAAATGGDVTVENISAGYLPTFVDVLAQLGATVSLGNDFIRARMVGKLRAVDVRTMPFPGFPTDLQAPLTAVLTLTDQTSHVTETVFENRFHHVPQLLRMGADIRVMERHALITGVPRLVGSCLTASDLRAGGALILAALAADGISTIENVFYIDRGYEKIEEKLRLLGAKINRMACDQ